jgi:hypothetical protein
MELPYPCIWVAAKSYVFRVKHRFAMQAVIAVLEFVVTESHTLAVRAFLELPHRFAPLSDDFPEEIVLD